MTMSNLSAFLAARLDEDETEGRHADLLWGETAADNDRGEREARAPREVTAKRLLMDEIFRYECKIDSEWGCCHSAESIAAGRCEETPPDGIRALRILAAIYSGHPDYRQEWAP